MTQRAVLGFILSSIMAFVLVGPYGAHAQGTGYVSISVPFDSAQFMWEVGPGYAERFGPTAHVITCGEYVKRVEMPATSVPVRERVWVDRSR